jgi:hypothetical protein
MLKEIFEAQVEEMKQKYQQGKTVHELADEYKRSTDYVRRSLGSVFVPRRDRRYKDRDAHIEQRVWNVNKGWV